MMTDLTVNMLKTCDGDCSLGCEAYEDVKGAGLKRKGTVFIARLTIFTIRPRHIHSVDRSTGDSDLCEQIIAVAVRSARVCGSNVSRAC